MYDDFAETRKEDMKHILLLTFIVLLQFSGFANSGFNPDQDEKQRIESELKIYPNPVKNNQVTLSFQTKEIAEVRLVNITGKEVLKQEYFFPQQKAILTLNEIPNGLYIAQIKTSEGQIISKKVMVARD